MRKLIYSMAVSLDGFVDSPNNALAPDEELHAFYNEQAREAGTELYGRRFYELMAGHWPTADANPASTATEAEYAPIWRDLPKVVVSTTLERVEWNSTLIRGDDLAEEVRKLKEQPGKDIHAGGPTLAASLIRLALVDEYRMFVFPVVTGGSLPYFPKIDQHIATRLVATRTFGSGVVYLRYQVR
jgi:dihydrofolate reductase